MAQIKVRSYVKINPAITKPGSGISASYAAALKGINRMGGAVESLGKNLETVDKLYKFRNEFLIQSQAKRIKLEDKLNAADSREEKLSEQKQKRWWRRFLDQKAEDATEKAAKDPNKVIDKKADIIKKALTPLQKFFQVFSGILEPIMRMFVLMPILNWITGQETGKLAKTIGHVITIVGFVRKLVGFGIGTLLDGLSNLFGGFDRIKHGNVAGVLQGFVGALQLVSGVALVKAAQYIFMPWKLIGDVKWVTSLFTQWGKITGEAEGAAKNRDIAAYVDKNGNTISKEDFEKAKAKARKNDERVGKRQGKGWSYSGGQDYLGDRYRAQYGGRNKGFLARNAQRGRIAFKRGTRGIRGQFKMAANWMEANPAKGNAIFSVIGGVTRAAGGLMAGEGGAAVGAGVGQAAGGIAGFALGNMLLPGIGGIIGSALGSFLGEWVGTKFGPMIDPILKPIGNAFKLSFDILSPVLGAIGGPAGEMFSALFDGLAALINLSTDIAKIGIDIIKFAWDNSGTKKAIDTIIWVWQNKDNVIRGAQGYADFLTFNLFDFDKQNKKAIGGPVVVPMMAAGGIIGTDSPEIMGLKNAGASLVATTISTLDRLGIVGNVVKTAIAPQLSVYSNLFGAGNVAVSGDRMQSQINKPSADLNVGSQSAPGQDNSSARKLIGEGQVTLLTAQPNGAFTPQNQKTTRGLLADIYNAFASARFGGGTTGPGGGPGGQIPSSGPVVQGGSADFWALAAIASREDVKPQGSADVAQSIYNRLGSGAYGGKTIKDIIISPGQYEPTFGNRSAWAAISDRQSAIKAAGSATNVDSSARSILNSQLQKNAVEFVQGRTDFLGESMKRNMRSDLGDITRGPGSNFFGWHNNYKKNKIASAPKFDAAMPTAAVGGKINAPSTWQGDTGPGSRWFEVASEESKQKWRQRNKGRLKTLERLQGYADGGKIAEAAKSMVGRQYYANACAKSTRDMLGKAGVVPKPEVTKFVLDKGTPGAEPTGLLKANSFGSDQGAVVKSSSAVKEGDIVMWDTGGGVIGHVGVAIGNGQVVHNSSSAGYKLAKMGVNGMKFHSAIRLGETGTISSSSQTQSTSTTGGKSLLEGGGGVSDPFIGAQQDLDKALKLWAEAFGGSTASASEALTPKSTPSVSASPSATSAGSNVQSGSEQHVSREATKPGTAAVVPVPIIASAGGQQPMPTFVKNTSLPRATVN